MECLDEETILAFCQGRLTAERRRSAEIHIGSCDECRTLVSAVVRSSIVEPRELLEPLASGASLGSDTTQAASTTRTDTEGSPSDSEAYAPVRPGDLVEGKYRIERMLGAGGMGVVVAARHIHLDQRVAMKFLRPSAIAMEGSVARFLREGRAAARITSEHVARVIDTGVLDGDAPYLVMEYLEGRDLAAELAERGQLPSGEAVALVLQACEALAEAHTLGIVHRDLKPQNLFLTRRADGSPLVKVLDFGISKVEGSSRSILTSNSVLMGSPRYMSPEQMLSAKDVDARTDVWALGVILFELVAGQPVWRADTLQGLCALIASAPAPPLREVCPAAPPLLADVIARCLAKTAAERIPSVAELALALAPIAPDEARPSIDRILGVAGRPRSTHPPAHASVRASAIEPATTRSGGRTARIAGAALAALALAALLVAALKPPSEVRSDAPAPETASASPAVASSSPTPPAPSTSAEAAVPALSTDAGATAGEAAATSSTSANQRPVLAKNVDAGAAPARADERSRRPPSSAEPSRHAPPPPERGRVEPDRALIDRK